MGNERAKALDDIKSMSAELTDHVDAMARVFDTPSNIERYAQLFTSAVETPRNVKDEAVKKIIQTLGRDSTRDADCSYQKNAEESRGSKSNPDVGGGEASESAELLYNCIKEHFNRLRTGKCKSPFLSSRCHREYSETIKNIQYLIYGVLRVHSLQIGRQERQMFADPEVYYYNFMKLFYYSLERLRSTQSSKDLAASVSGLINAILDQLEFFRRMSKQSGQAT
jgi:hypothetical protein